MKVLLVQPPQFGKPGFTKIARVEPLGLEMVAGALIDDHQVRIHDMRIDENLEKAINSFRPDAVGISCCFTIDVYRAQRIARRVKNAGVPFVFVGGLHASLNPPDFDNKDIDCIVVGEGEFASRDLIGTLEAGSDLRNVPGIVLNTDKGQVFTGPREPVKNMDDLPFAARDLLPHGRGNKYFFNFWKPMATIETARGCPYRCNFCSVWAFFQGRCRTKSPERVAEELSRRSEPYILITDDNFLLSVKRAREIADIIKARGIKKRYSFQARSDTICKHPEIITQWKQIGLAHIFIGFESLNQEDLQAINKKNSVETNEQALKLCQDQGLSVTTAFIINQDFEHSDFEKLRNYIVSRRISLPQFTVLTPLPGTDLFREMEEKIQIRNYELYDFIHSVLPTKLDPKDFYKEFASLYSAAYIHSGVIKRRSSRLLKDLAARRLSLPHIIKVLRGAREFADGANYMQPLNTAGQSGDSH
ncbi:B12 binding domain protein [bacterium BMS3Abin01]|nr:B12 binding domain protein [bacterium BMS3Abin01]HDZ59767.1 radical SAM protein [Actinomycetota bacterium]